MVLLDDVVQIFDLPDGDGSFSFGVDVVQGRQVGRTAVDGHGVGLTVVRNGLLEKARRRGLVALGAQQKADGMARLVDRSVKVLPLATYQDVGLVHASAFFHWALTKAKPLVQRRQQLERPAVELATSANAARFLTSNDSTACNSNTDRPIHCTFRSRRHNP